LSYPYRQRTPSTWRVEVEGMECVCLQLIPPNNPWRDRPIGAAQPSRNRARMVVRGVNSDGPPGSELTHASAPARFGRTTAPLPPRSWRRRRRSVHSDIRLDFGL